jgi:hypothetical protein
MRDLGVKADGVFLLWAFLLEDSILLKKEPPCPSPLPLWKPAARDCSAPSPASKVLVQTSGAGRDDGGMRQFEPLDSIFKGRHFEREIIILCVRWYQSFKLSFRDLAAMMAERGISVAHSTILRWVQHFTPQFEKRWQRFARSVGGS